MKLPLTISVIAILLTAPAVFAQSQTLNSPRASPNSLSASPTNPPGESQPPAGSSQNLAIATKIQQDLKNAGFTDVRVVAESFVVQAKSKDGDPVLMTIGPHGMSVFEAMKSNGNSNNSGSNSGTSSQSGTTGSANSPSQNSSR